MIIKQFLLLLCCCAMLSSCGSNDFFKEKEEICMPVSISNDSINYLIDRSILNGDTNAYSIARSYFFIRSQYSQFLHYAILMSNIHNSKMASYDVYFILTHSKWGVTIDKLDSNTKKLALSYLFRSKK